MKKLQVIIVSLIGLIASCGSSTGNLPHNKTPLKSSEKFNEYWFNGDAEITSYQLEQARYGEIHKGNAVLIFVTEPFNIEKQVKSDNPNEKTESVLKLNFTKKFNTGIYPYSMMTSSFLPLQDLTLPVKKITCSVQEWCGHVFTQINNKHNKWEVNSFSYFESEGDQQVRINQDILEDELWSRIRTNPDILPIGKHKIIPSLFYLRLMHQPLIAYDAEISKNQENNLIKYTIHYPKLGRDLVIYFSTTFPYSIEKWEETYQSGWGEKATTLITKATKTTTLKTPYWKKNSNIDSVQRDSLGLN